MSRGWQVRGQSGIITAGAATVIAVMLLASVGFFIFTGTGGIVDTTGNLSVEDSSLSDRFDTDTPMQSPPFEADGTNESTTTGDDTLVSGLSRPLPNLVASLSEEEGRVGEVVGVELDVTSFSGVGGDSLGSYSFVLSYDSAVLSFDSVEGNGWSEPASVNDIGDAVAVADYDVTDETPTEPALTFNFQIVGSGMSEITFDNNVSAIPAENVLNNGDAYRYAVQYESGGAGTGGQTPTTTLTSTPGITGPERQETTPIGEQVLSPPDTLDEAPDGPVGDANKDGKVAIADGQFIAQFLVGIPVDNFDEFLANVSRQTLDGRTNVQITDAQRIAEYTLNASLAPNATVTGFDPDETITAGDSLNQSVTVGNSGQLGAIYEVYYSIATDETFSEVPFKKRIEVVDLTPKDLSGNATGIELNVTPEDLPAGEYRQRLNVTGEPPKKTSIDKTVTKQLIIEPAAPDSASIVTEPTDTTAGETIEGTPEVNVTDEFGNGIEGETVNVSVATGPASLTDDSTTEVQTGPQGVATFDNLVLETAGTYTLTFDAENVSGSQGLETSEFNISAAGAANVTVETQPTDTTAGEIIGGPPTANVTDEFGNAVEGVEVTVSSVDNGTTPQTTNGSGIATFGDLNITSAGTKILSFNVSNVDNATTDEFEITPAAVESVEISPPGDQTVAAGEEIAFSATAEDRFGNVNESTDSAFSWSTTGENISTAGLFNETSADESGTDYEVNATLDDVTSEPTTVTVEPAAVDNVTISPPSDQTVAAGEEIAFSATAEDQFGNVNESTDSAFNWSASGGNITGSGVFNETSAAEPGTDYGVTAERFGETSLETTVTVQPASASSVSVSTQPAESTAGATIDGEGSASAPNATVTDAFGNPVSGAEVTVSANGMGSIVSGTTQVSTGSDGVATFSDLVIETAGEYTLTFAVSGVSSDAESNSFSVTAAPADSVSVSTQPADSEAGTTIGGEGSASAPNATVTDEFGNAVSGVDVSVSANGPGSITSGTTTVPTDGSGVATFSDLVIEDAGDYTLTFSAASDTATTSTFTISAAAAASVSVETEPTDTTAGTTIGGAPAAKVTDEFGNPVSGVDVSVSASGPGSITSGTTLVSTDGSGVATFSDLVIEDAGDYTLTFSAASDTATTSTFTISAAAASSVSVETEPTDTIAGTTIGGSPAAKVTDEFGNPVSGVDVSVSANGPGSITSGTTTVPTDGSGVATFGDLVIEDAGDYTLTFSAASDTATTSAFTISAAASSSVSVATQPSDTTAGTTIGGSPAAKVTDEFGNAVSGVDVSVSASGPGSITSGTTLVSTDGSGVVTFSDLVIEDAGDYTLTFSAASDTATTSTFTISAAAASSVSVETEPTDTTAGTTIGGSPAAKVTDEFGNPVSGVDVSVSANGPGLITSGTTPVPTDGSGVASFGDLVLEDAGDYTLTFDASGVSSNADSSQFTVSAASASSMSVETEPTDTTAGTTIGGSPAAKVTDEFGNAVSGVDVSVSANGPGSITSGTTPVPTDGSGVATFGDLVLEDAGDYTLTFDAAGVTATVDSSQFTVSAASASSVSVETEPSDSTAGTTIGGAPAVKVTDEFGNAVSGVDVSVSANGPGSITSGATTVPTDGSGVATFSDLVIEDAGDYTLTFSAASDTATTSTFTISAAAASSVSVTVNSGTATADGSDELSFTVTVEDANNNPVPNVGVETTDNVTDIEYGGDDSQTTDDQGEVTVTATSTTAQDVEFTFTEQQTGNNDATATGTFLQPAEYIVTITGDISDGTTEGETVALGYSVENAGEATGEQNVVLKIAGQTVVTETDVSVPGGDTQSFTFENAEIPATGELLVEAIPDSGSSDSINFVAPGLIYGGDGVAIHEAENLALSSTLGDIGGENSVEAIAVSPDESQVVLGGANGAVLYDTGDWSEGTTLTTGSIQDVAWGADIAVATGSSVERYDTSGTLLGTLTDPSGTVTSIAWDSGDLAVGARDNRAYVYTSFSGGADEVLEDPRNDVLSVAWSPGGGELAVGDADGAVFVYDSSFDVQTSTRGVTTDVSLTGLEPDTESVDRPFKLAAERINRESMLSTNSIWSPGIALTSTPGPNITVDQGFDASYVPASNGHVFEYPSSGDALITFTSAQNTEAAFAPGVDQNDDTSETVLTERSDRTLDVSNPLTVDPADKAELTLQGSDVNEFSYTALDLNSETRDLSYDLGSGSMTFTFDGLSGLDGEELSVVDTATDDELATGVVSSGEVTFTVDRTGQVDATVVLEQATIELGQAVESLAWYGTELAVATGSSVELYDTSDFTKTGTLNAPSTVTDIAYNADGSEVAYTAGGSTFVHDDTGSRIATLKKAGNIQTVTYLPAA